MTINHINLSVADVAAATLFFETYFGFTCTLVKGDNIISILKNDDGFTLVLMSAATNKKGNATYPDVFHIGFMFNNKEEVIETYMKLKTGGISVGDEPRKIRDSFGFYFHFDNIMIEIGQYIE